MTNEYNWDVDKNDPTIINIMHNKKKIMKIYIGEAMEVMGRTRVMKIIAECDMTPWLKNWIKE